MKQKIEHAIKNKRIQIAFIEYLVAIGLIVALFVMMTPKDQLLDTTYSYSKVKTEVSKYEIEGNYMTRVMPLTDYETFKKIAETTLNNTLKDNNYTVKVYSDENRTKEITTGYIASGMVTVAIPENEETMSEIVTQSKETETQANVEVENETVEETLQQDDESTERTPKEEIPAIEEVDEEIIYTISVIGDFTNDGDINVTELTKITKCVVGLSNWKFTEEEKLAADLNGDGTVNISDIECCINYIVFGELEVKEKEYTVTFKDYDGRIISTKTNYHYGDKIEIPEDPTREADETYTYEFAGWNPEISEAETVTGNAEYIATYREISNRAVYKVEHYKEKLDGSYELAETETLEGKKGEEVRAKVKEYIGFSEDTEKEDRIASGTVLEDGSLTLKLYYNRNQYTVTLTKDENIESVSLNGENIATKSYKYGESVTINTVLKEEAGYTIIFNKWVSSDTTLVADQTTQEAIIEIPAGNVELTATTTKEANQVVYKVEHYKEELDGTYELTETESLEGITGEEVTAKAKTYIGFSEDVENKDRVASGTILGDGSLTLKLFYNRNEYMVIFKDYNGTEISKVNYKYEERLNIPDNPAREADETYTYEFLGWNPEVTEIVTDNAEYKAQYTETYIGYSITFKDYDGTVISSKTDYHYGDIIEVPESPMREADDNYEYEFAGWKKEGTGEIGVTAVKKDEVYTATYQETAFKILIEREDGTLEKYVSFEKAFAAITDENIKIQLIGDVTESITIPENKNVTLDLNNYKIASNQTSTITNNGNLLIVDNSIEKGGMVENTENIVITNNGNLTLGYDDGVVEENILIKGQTNAIQNNNNFYMYDGTLMGRNTITGNNAIIPEGEEYGISIREEDGIQIASIQIIEIPQALVGETYYTTLQQAIDENNNEIIYVVKKNIELIDVLTIDETKNLTIDLNGNSITKTANTEYVIKNAGTLTITNTNESNEGTISSTTGSAIYNTANLKIQNVTINSYSYGVYNAKDLNMEDVNIESSNSYGVYNTHTSNDINFTMLRGSVTGSSGIGNSKEGSYVDHTGNIWVQITNATIEAKLNYMIYNSNFNYTDYTNTSEIIVEIDGGTLKSQRYGINNNGANMKLQLKNSKLDVENCYSGISLSDGPNEVLLENTQINMTADDYNQHCQISCSGDYNLVIDKNTQITSTNTKGAVYAIYSTDSQNANSSGHIKLIDGTISAIAKGDTRYYGGYGVSLSSGYFDFLGGSINATTKTIDASIGSIAEGKQIQTVQEENKYVSTLVDAISTNYVASIGEEKYDSLKGAIAACENAEQATTITMLADYEQWESVTISEQKNIILDLNGHKITAHSEFLNEGQFEVTDTSEEQTGIVEEKTGRAIFNKENGIFTLSGGTILLNSTTLSKCAIYNTDQASINMKGGTIEVNHSKTYGSQYIIYNISTGDIKVTGGELKGDITNTGTLYGIYNYINDEGGDRNVSIANAKIDISYNRASVYGIYNYTTHNSNVTDLSRDTIDLEVSGSNINIEGSDTSSSYGIYNYASYGRDTIKMNLKNSTLDVNNNYYYSGSSDSWGGAYGIYNTANTNSSSSFIYNNIEGGSIKATGKYTGRRYGIYNSGGNIAINLGIQGEESQKQEPSILGDTYGINSSSSNTINFFQGIIKGTSAISDTTILSLEEGKEINRYIDETDGYDTIVIQNKTPEAKIGETEYMTLQEAIDACPDDSEEFTTIELIKEVNNSAQNVTVEETKKVTLDLKGYNLTSLADCTIINKGDLNILDSVGTGSIKNNSKTAIGNYGGLTINTISVYGKTIGIANYQNANAELNEVNIEASSRGINNAGNINLNSSAIIMTAGTYGVYNSGSMNIISSDISIKYGNGSTYGIYNSGNVLNIKNSNITSEETNSYYSYVAYAIYASSGIVNISDKESGEEDTTIISSSHIGISKSTSYASTKINYYGGKIVAKEKLLDGGLDEILEGKEILLSEEDSKKVATLVDKQEGNVVKIRDTGYESIEKAISSIPEELEEQTEIQLISDIKINCSNERISIPKEKNIKLDLNGYEIVSYDLYAISNKGKFEIIDTNSDKTGKIISEFNSAINNNGELTINGGYINAKQNGISNSNNGTIIMNSGAIDIEANESKGISAISSNTGTVNLCGGNINVTKEKGQGGSFTYGIYAAGIYVRGANLTIDGTNISLTNNQSEAYTYGIRTYNSKINYKSGTMYVESTYYGSAYGIFGYRYDSGSSIEINGGSIEVVNAIQYGYGIYLESESGTNNVCMTGGKLKTNGINSNGGSSGGIYCRINNDNCGVNITGGTIEATGTTGGTAVSGSNITIGVKDGNMDKTNPVIEGKSCGVNSTNFKFYDGTIRGATALTQSPVDVEAGYKVSIASSGELQSATLTLVSTAEAIAQIGNLYFNDLQQAINACTELDTINILTGIKCNQTLTIEEGKTVTIDLMGNTLTANGIENIIENYGTLTIVDSVGGGSINGNINNHGELNQP